MNIVIDYYHANIFEILFLFLPVNLNLSFWNDTWFLSYLEIRAVIRAVIHLKSRMECILLDVTGDKRPN